MPKASWTRVIRYLFFEAPSAVFCDTCAIDFYNHCTVKCILPMKGSMAPEHACVVKTAILIISFTVPTLFSYASAVLFLWHKHRIEGGLLLNKNIQHPTVGLTM